MLENGSNLTKNNKTDDKFFRVIVYFKIYFLEKKYVKMDHIKLVYYFRRLFGWSSLFFSYQHLDSGCACSHPCWGWSCHSQCHQHHLFGPQMCHWCQLACGERSAHLSAHKSCTMAVMWQMNEHKSCIIITVLLLSTVFSQSE